MGWTIFISTQKSSLLEEKRGGRKRSELLSILKNNLALEPRDNRGKQNEEKGRPWSKDSG